MRWKRNKNRCSIYYQGASTHTHTMKHHRGTVKHESKLNQVNYCFARYNTWWSNNHLLRCCCYFFHWTIPLKTDVGNLRATTPLSNKHKYTCLLAQRAIKKWFEIQLFFAYIRFVLVFFIRFVFFVVGILSAKVNFKHFEN